jgi:hypothetical protein
MANIDRSTRLQRREFIAAGTGAVAWLLLPPALRAAQPGAPADNPVAFLKLTWTDDLKWANVLDVTQVSGKDIMEKLAKAQAQLAAKGGGVVYFPRGSIASPMPSSSKTASFFVGRIPRQPRNHRRKDMILPASWSSPNTSSRRKATARPSAPRSRAFISRIALGLPGAPPILHSLIALHAEMPHNSASIF